MRSEVYLFVAMKLVVVGVVIPWQKLGIDEHERSIWTDSPRAKTGENAQPHSKSTTLLVVVLIIHSFMTTSFLKTFPKWLNVVVDESRANENACQEDICPVTVQLLVESSPFLTGT